MGMPADRWRVGWTLVARPGDLQAPSPNKSAGAPPSFGTASGPLPEAWNTALVFRGQGPARPLSHSRSRSDPRDRSRGECGARWVADYGCGYRFPPLWAAVEPPLPFGASPPRALRAHPARVPGSELGHRGRHFGILWGCRLRIFGLHRLRSDLGVERGVGSLLLSFVISSLLAARGVPLAGCFLLFLVLTILFWRMTSGPNEADLPDPITYYFPDP